MRPGLIDRGLLGGDLAGEPLDGRPLGRRLVAGRISGEPVVSVIDPGNNVASADMVLMTFFRSVRSSA